MFHEMSKSKVEVCVMALEPKPKSMWAEPSWAHTKISVIFATIDIF